MIGIFIFLQTTKIKNYELTYGVVYDKEVLKDMANIPPQNYNYNPQTFVPQYPVNNPPEQNQDISAFTDDDKKKGCKKDLTALVVGMISLSTLGIVIKKREK